MLPIVILLALLASFSVQFLLPSFDGWSLPWEIFARACVQIAVSQLAVLMSFIFIIKESKNESHIHQHAPKS